MKNNKLLTILWVLIATLGRLIPHLPNTSPFTSLSVLAGQRLSKKLAITIMLTSLLLSDCLLAWLKGYPLFGAWTLFNYSGFLIILLAANCKHAANNQSLTPLLGLTALASLFFWTWTNFGTWLTAGLYPTTLAGLLQCYVAGIPFLQNALITSLLWTALLSTALNATKKALLTD